MREGVSILSGPTYYEKARARNHLSARHMTIQTDSLARRYIGLV
jgi:hypothetical protein